MPTTAIVKHLTEHGLDYPKLMIYKDGSTEIISYFVNSLYGIRLYSNQDQTKIGSIVNNSINYRDFHGEITIRNNKS